MDALIRSVAAAATVCACFSAALADDPDVPPGRDPGGVAVAIITAGIDYRVPAVAAALARDGEGEIIGWDFADDDRKPFASRNADAVFDATSFALRLAGGGGLRIVVVRIDPADASTLAHAVAFIARTPARLVALPLTSQRPEDWSAFRSAAEHFQEQLFVLAAGDNGQDIDQEVYPAALNLANGLVIAESRSSQHAASPHTNLGAVRVRDRAVWELFKQGERFSSADAVALAARSIALCAGDVLNTGTGAEKRKKVLARLGRSEESQASARIEPCPEALGGMPPEAANEGDGR